MGVKDLRRSDERLVIKILGRGDKHGAKTLDTIDIPLQGLLKHGGYAKRDFRMDRNNCKVQLELTLKDARQFAPVIVPAGVVMVHPVPPPVGASVQAVQLAGADAISESSFPSFRDSAQTAESAGLKMELESITANLPSISEQTPVDFQTGRAPPAHPTVTERELRRRLSSLSGAAATGSVVSITVSLRSDISVFS